MSALSATSAHLTTLSHVPSLPVTSLQVTSLQASNRVAQMSRQQNLSSNHAPSRVGEDVTFVSGKSVVGSPSNEKQLNGHSENGIGADILRSPESKNDNLGDDDNGSRVLEGNGEILKNGAVTGGWITDSTVVDGMPRDGTLRRRISPDVDSITSDFTPMNEVDNDSLLAQLEAANRMLEADSKSLRSLSPHSPRARQHHRNTSGDGGGSGGKGGEGGRTAGGLVRAWSGRSKTGSHHSRQNSISSEVSSLSVASSTTSQQSDEMVPDDLWCAWRTVVDEWDGKSKKKASYIKDLVRRGVPHHFRGIVWPLLCGAREANDRERYVEYMRNTSPCEKLIRRDITRTYPDHKFFKEKNGTGQESLFNVMKAYSLHDREVGYCQGSGFIVGLLLMQMPEEEAFAVVVKIMQQYKLRELFKPSMAELGLCMFQLESMIQDQLPELHTHLQAQGFHVSMFATPWFLTLFTTSLSMPLACRVFDIFLSEGIEIIFRVGFAMLQMTAVELLTQDMEGMIKLLQKDLPARLDADPDALINAAFQVKYSVQKMKKLRKEYSTMKSKEKQDEVELRRLKTENRLLRQRIENFETENAMLADRLIQDQVQHAVTSEEVYALRREVSYSNKRQNNNTASINVAQGSKMECSAESMPRCDGMTPCNVHGGGVGGLGVVVGGVVGVGVGSRVKELERSLADASDRETRSKALVQELREKIQELEHSRADERAEDVSSLHDQLIASKLREADANMAVRELQLKVNELERHWQRHMDSADSSCESRSRTNKTKLQEVSEQLMTSRLKETHLLAELATTKHRTTELETEGQVSDRRLKRVESENAKLKEKVSELEQTNSELRTSIQDFERRVCDVETKMKEEGMMARIREAEHSQSTAEMRRRIAELEIRNQELLTVDQLRSTRRDEKTSVIGGQLGSCSSLIGESRLSEAEELSVDQRIAELKDELSRLKFSRVVHRMSSTTSSQSTSGDVDSDDEYILDVNRLPPLSTPPRLSPPQEEDQRTPRPSSSPHRSTSRPDSETNYEFEQGTLKATDSAARNCAPKTMTSFEYRSNASSAANLNAATDDSNSVL